MTYFTLDGAPPLERTRYIIFDETGWCIGDCFYGHASNPFYYNDDTGTRIERKNWDRKCWRYADSEREVNSDFSIKYYMNLPSIDVGGIKFENC